MEVSSETADVLSPAQMRAARGLLGLDQAQVAQLAGLKQNTISRFEGGEDFSVKNKRRRDALKAIRQAFEQQGVEFIFRSDVSGEGVRLRLPEAGAATESDPDETTPSSPGRYGSRRSFALAFGGVSCASH
ncbi:transcriptional regulator with XRE-family HTH domain [Bradyrhizobium sp. USDA 4501]